MQSPLPVSAAIETKIATLSQKSYTGYIDVKTSLEWSKGVNRTIAPKREDANWFYGTRFWDALTDAQKLEVSWNEMARDVSMFIWLEQTIPPLYMSYVNNHGSALSPVVSEYLMHFSKEEIVHTLMFRRYMEMGKLPYFAPPDGLHTLYCDTLFKMPPFMGILATYLVELVAEEGALYATELKDSDPLTRDMAYLHHTEEARHIAFGRWITEGHIEARPESAAQARPFVEQLLKKLLANYVYNQQLPRHLSFDLGVSETDEAKHHEIRTSANNTRINQIRFSNMLTWLKKLQLVGPDFTLN